MGSKEKEVQAAIQKKPRVTKANLTMSIPATITLPAGNGPPPPAPDEESHLLGSVPPVPNHHFNHYIGGNNGPTVKPMMSLEASRRRHMIWTMSLLVVFFAMFGCLAVWRFQHAETHAPSAIASRAEHALFILNRHYHAQSKVMAAGCEATILIIRHCEKVGPNVMDADGNIHCSYVGAERSKYIATLFGTDPASGARWPQPSYMFALTPDRNSHWNFREFETLHPLSKKTGITVDLVDQDTVPVKLFELLQSGALCGRVAVVSWKHEYIHDLATALGCGPDDGCPLFYPEDTFDQVWQLKYVFRPSLLRDVQDETNMEVRQQPETPNTDGTTPDTTTTNINDDDDNVQNRRVLKKAKKQPNDAWFMFGSVQHQNFDPLAFSFKVGDYNPEQGVPSGGRWKDEI